MRSGEWKWRCAWCEVESTQARKWLSDGAEALRNALVEVTSEGNERLGVVQLRGRMLPSMPAKFQCSVLLQ